MAIKHLPSGYKPLVNQCGVKFDVQRVCTEENVGPQVLTLNWPSNVEQYALYAASCEYAGGAGCGQYAAYPNTNGSTVHPEDELTGGNTDPWPGGAIYLFNKPNSFSVYGVPVGSYGYGLDRAASYIWRNDLGHAIRVLDVRIRADGAVGTAPGGDASQGQNAINRAQGAGFLPAWERSNYHEANLDLGDVLVAFALRANTHVPYVWPGTNERNINRVLWATNPYDGTPLSIYDTEGWWHLGGTLQLPIHTELTPKLALANQAQQSDPLALSGFGGDTQGSVVNPGEDVAVVLYQYAYVRPEDFLIGVFAPITIEIVYEEVEPHGVISPLKAIDALIGSNRAAFITNFNVLYNAGFASESPPEPERWSITVNGALRSITAIDRLGLSFDGAPLTEGDVLELTISDTSWAMENAFSGSVGLTANQTINGVYTTTPRVWDSSSTSLRAISDPAFPLASLLFNESILHAMSVNTGITALINGVVTPDNFNIPSGTDKTMVFWPMLGPTPQTGDVLTVQYNGTGLWTAQGQLPAFEVSAVFAPQ